MSREEVRRAMLAGDEDEIQRHASSLPIPVVSEEGGIVTLHFRSDYVQSQMVRDDPEFLALAYTRAMMAFEMFMPDPRCIALIGLGGGSLAKWCYRHHATAELTVVEINPHVIALRDRFHIPEDDHRFRVICEDGSRFVAEHSGGLDVLLVDVFDVDSLPRELSSQEFYAGCYRSLAARGLLVVNVCAADVRRVSSHLKRSFGGLTLHSTDKDGNTVFFACKGEPLWAEKPPAKFLESKLREFDRRHGLKRAIRPVG